MIQVETYESKGTILHLVHFTKAIFLSNFIDVSGDEIWTLIPQSNFPLAIKIGKLIEHYYSTKSQQRLF